MIKLNDMNKIIKLIGKTIKYKKNDTVHMIKIITVVKSEYDNKLYYYIYNKNNKLIIQGNEDDIYKKLLNCEIVK